MKIIEVTINFPNYEKKTKMQNEIKRYKGINKLIEIEIK